MKIITKNATAYDSNGYISAEGVEVCDHGETISIGATEHNKSDLVIGEHEIAPVGFDSKTMWSVRTDAAKH